MTSATRILAFFITWLATSTLTAQLLSEERPQWLERISTNIVAEQGKIVELKIYGASGIWKEGQYTRKCASNEELALLRDLPSLKKLTIFNYSVAKDENITDAGLKHLGDLAGLESLTLRGLAISDAGLASLRTLKSLRHLSLNDLQLTESGLVHLLELPSLESLALGGMKLTELELIRLKKLKSLKSLTLSKSLTPGPLKPVHALRLKDEWVVHFNDMPGLMSLSLLQTGITSVATTKLKLAKVETLTLHGDNLAPFDLRGYRAELENVDLRGCKSLKTLTLTTQHLLSLQVPKSLNSLHFVQCQVSDCGLKHLKDIPSLHHLRLQMTRISTDGLAHLKDIDALGSLEFNYTRISNEVLVHLRDCKSLQSLVFDHTGISKKIGMDHLKALTSLKKLMLDETGLWETDAAILRKALPGCKVEWDDSALYAP